VVLQLVDEGKLRLDDDVTKYVPEAPTLGHHGASAMFIAQPQLLIER